MDKWRIVFHDGAWMDMQMNLDGFSFVQFIQTARSAGFFLSGDMYFRFDMVRAILPYGPEGQAPGMGAGNAPTTETKQ